MKHTVRPLVDKFIANSDKYIGFNAKTNMFLSNEKDLDKALKNLYKGIYNRDSLVETFVGSSIDTEIKIPKAVSICPFRGSVDVYEIVIRYKSNNKIIEMEALKAYIEVFMYIGATHEYFLSHLHRILKEQLDPLELFVSIDASPFFGFGFKVHKHYVKDSF